MLTSCTYASWYSTEKCSLFERFFFENIISTTMVARSCGSTTIHKEKCSSHCFYFFQCLLALGTETTSLSSAAQCVSYIACTEIPASQWPELMNHLVENVIKVESTDQCKKATLEAIGYICQDIVCFN